MGMTAALPTFFNLHKGMSHIIFYMLVWLHTHIHQYNNTTIKIVNCNANIYFNQECIKNSIIPQYAKLQISHTSLVNIQ
jgi:hypothetical protein